MALWSWLFVSSAVAVALVAAVYLWFLHRFSYWKRRGVPHIKATIPFGSVTKALMGHMRIEFLFQEFYMQHQGERCLGFYALHAPCLLIFDPDLIRDVVVKDFDAFQDRCIPFDDSEPLNQHLLLMNGVQWRRLRAKLTPAFTSGKLKAMFPVIDACGRELVEVLEAPARRGDVVEVRDVAARFTTDVIGNVAFGVRCNCQRDPRAEFREWGRKIFEFCAADRVEQLLLGASPPLAKLFRAAIGRKDVLKYFEDMVKETVRYREASHVERNDFMQLLIQLKNKGFVDDDKPAGPKANDDDFGNWRLSLDHVAAQALLFFAAGFETSSTTMSYALYELALNPAVQRRLQQEVDEALRTGGGAFSYEALVGMPYLDRVVCETLRKYPPVAFLPRKCTRPYRLPGGAVVGEGVPVFVPTHALHNDPRYFPEPDRFDPDRFCDEQRAARHPYVYLPFGEGPRNCVGMRLGLLQTKLGLAHLVSRAEVSRCALTPAPLRYDPLSIVLMPAGGLHLKLTSRG